MCKIPSPWKVKKIKNRYYLYHYDQYVGPLEEIIRIYQEWRRGRDLNPRGVFPHRLSRPDASCEVTPQVINRPIHNTESRETVHTCKLLVKWGNLQFNVENERDAELLLHILRNIHAAQQPPQPKTVTVVYDEKFREYLLKDRGLDPKTARDYMNYLKRLHGRSLDYDLYLSIAGSRWMVKTVRLYVDYLYKSGSIDEQTRDHLLNIFKVKSQPKAPRPHSVNTANLVEPIKKMSTGLYRTILLVLYYSGARLSEAVHMLKTFDPQNLYCHEHFCRYWLGWHRGRKRADWVYFPKELLPYIYSTSSIGSYSTIRDELHDYYHVNVKLYRKHFYQTCRDLGTSKEVCDFYQSRISSLSIGDIHYDNLLKRADEHYPKLAAELKKRLNP